MSHAKKIVLVTDAWDPQINGVVRVLHSVISRAEARGYDITVIEPGQFKTFSMPFYPEIRLSLFPRRKVAKMLEEINPDAVVLVTEGPLGWAARAACKAQGRTFISWYHSHFQLYVDARLHFFLTPVQAFLRRFHAAATHTMVSTESLKQDLESKGFTHVVIMPLGVDVDMFVRTEAPELPEFTAPVFVYFSRLATEKSPETFMQLDLPGTKLVIGDGPLRKKLEKKYGDTHHFVGYKKGKELVEWLSKAHVFVFPSKTETFGLVSLEALACGLPVAAHDVMGPRDIVSEGLDGYLSDDLQSAALKCLDLSSEDCRKKAEQFSWEHSVDAFLQVLFPAD